MDKTLIAEEITRDYPDTRSEIIVTIRQLEDKKYLETIKNKDAEIERLNQILLNFKRERFGQRSEKTKYVISDIDQPTLFNEAEISQDMESEEGKTDDK